MYACPTMHIHDYASLPFWGAKYQEEKGQIEICMVTTKAWYC
jgi:hypothetical protein